MSLQLIDHGYPRVLHDGPPVANDEEFYLTEVQWQRLCAILMESLAWMRGVTSENAHLLQRIYESSCQTPRHGIDHATIGSAIAKVALGCPGLVRLIQPNRYRFSKSRVNTKAIGIIVIYV